MERLRRSRFDNSPFLDSEGRPTIVLKTEWLFRQLEIIARYPFLEDTWIGALSGGDPESIRKCFKVAKCKPNNWVRIADYQSRDKHTQMIYLRSKLVWQPGTEGEKWLYSRGVVIDTDEYSGPGEHRLDSCKVRASFELGATGSVSIIPWPIINADNKSSPYIPTGRFYLDKKRERKELRQRADCNPFIVNIEGEQRRRHYLAGFELDHATESLVIIRDKMESHIAILENKAYRDHLGFPDLVFPWVTTNTVHMHNIMAEWKKLAPKRFHDNALFKVFKNEPTGWALTEPWLTCHGELVYLNQ